MSGVKHTPGPWEIIPAQPHEEIEGAFATFASIEGADGMPVCVFGDCSGSATMFENEADYRLIAAAPDHHAVALELDRLALVIESAVRFADPAFNEEVQALLRTNKAAIARARGEQDGGAS